MKSAHFSFIATLLFSVLSFSQSEPRIPDTIICYDIDPSGFLLVNRQKFDDYLSKVIGNSISEHPFSVSFDATVDSVSDEQANLANKDGNKIAIPVMGFVGDSLSRYKISVMKEITIKEVRFSQNGKTDPSMKKKFDPRHVYIPKSMGVSSGDHISVENYTAILNDTCYVGHDSHQKAAVIGSFKVR